MHILLGENRRDKNVDRLAAVCGQSAEAVPIAARISWAELLMKKGLPF
jgi:hypothetical protein